MPKIVVVAILVILACDSVSALETPRILLTVDGDCQSAPECSDLAVTAGDVESIWLAMYVNGASEVSEVYFGLEMRPQLLAYAQCAGDLHFTQVLEPVLGVQWLPHSGCISASAPSYLGGIGIWVDSPSRIRIVDHPTLGAPSVRDCHGALRAVNAEHRGFVGIGGMSGYLPCTDLVPVAERSWASVKSLYAR
jgi:hypothetical protein